MVIFFYKMIKAGRWTIERVPVALRDEVQALVDADETGEQE